MNDKKAEQTTQFDSNNPEEYWVEVANQAFWFKPWTQTLDRSNKPLYRWFVGGETNICYNLLDRHVDNGDGAKVAAIWESATTKSSGKITYSELLNRVSKFAGGLCKLDVVKGDVVFIYMPNILELSIAILATWRIGGIAVSPLPNTTANAIADRIQLSKPKIFVTSNETKINSEMVFFKKTLDEAMRKLNYQAKVVVFQRKELEPAAIFPNNDILWEDLVRTSELTKCVPVESNEASMISFSSGTTGKPKGFMFCTGGFIVFSSSGIKTDTLKSMNNASVTMSPSHPGWISGIVTILCPMIDARCGVIYDGDGTGNGDIETLYRIIQNHKVGTTIFNVATLRDLRLGDPNGVHAKKYDLTSVTTLLAGGEAVDQISREWSNKIFPVEMVEMWGQTEGPLAMEEKERNEDHEIIQVDGNPKFPTVGYTLKIFDEEGKELPAGETGYIAAKLPLPPTFVITLYNDDASYIKDYCTDYPGYFNTHDLGWMDKHGGLHVLGRGNDIMKVSGVTMSATETENALLKNPNIAECVVVPLKHKEMYMVPIAFYILKKGKQDDEILLKMKEHIKECFGPAVIFNFALEVNGIAKTLTGKITRKAIQTEMQNLIKEVSHEDNAETILQGMKKAASNLGML